uniref:Uncharacterized protein n=1 Tax=Candidatus Desulfatibia profunda TaxID=2841695 RepID=A0A8J6TIP7_9BACT|nr:hypothetical protein [Candidatus Desulfatibia profunda]
MPHSKKQNYGYLGYSSSFNLDTSTSADKLRPLAQKNLDDLSSDYLSMNDSFCSSLDVVKFLWAG